MALISRTQVSTQAARAAQKEAGVISHSFEGAKAELTSIQGEQNKLIGQITELAVELKGLKKHAKTNAKKIKTVEAKLAAAQKANASIAAKLPGVIDRLTTGSAKLKAAETAALNAARAANATAASESRMMPFARAQSVDGLDDAASLSRADQLAVLGAPVQLSPAEALKGDVERLKLATRAGNGAQALQQLLAGTDPANQAALLTAVGDQLPMIARSTFLPAVTGLAAASSYLKAMDSVTPEARALMVKSLAAAAPAGDLAGTAYAKALTGGTDFFDSGPLGNGEGFGAAMELNKALTAAGKGKAADSVARFMAQSIPDLRASFEAKSKVTDALKGELALLNNGFGPLMTDPQKAKAINAFKDQHTQEFGELDLAASKLSGALEALKGLEIKAGPTSASEIRKGADLIRKNGLAGPDGADMAGTVLLQAEALKLRELLPALGDTEAGGEAVRQALLQQREGKPSWLDSATTMVGNTKDLSEGVAKVVASGIGQLALRGEVGTEYAMVNLLRKNARALGITGGQLDELSNAFIDATGSKASTEKLKLAFNKIEAGEFGTSKVTTTALKSIGLAVQLYATAKGVGDWSEGSALEHAKVLTGAAKLGIDGTSMVMEMMGKKSVLESLSKMSAGASAVTGVLDVVSGIQGISEGNIGEGSADVMSGAGGVLMAAATLAESFPGGQLPGAVLAVAGVVTRLIVGNRAAAKAEDAAEADAKQFLIGGGVPAAMAAELSNVRRDDHTNVGQAIIQLAPKLNTTPQKLFELLLAQSPQTVDQFVKMALDLKHDDTMKIADTNGGWDDSSTIHTTVVQHPGGPVSTSFRPRSLENAAAWMRSKGLAPK